MDSGPSVVGVQTFHLGPKAEIPGQARPEAGGTAHARGERGERGRGG